MISFCANCKYYRPEYIWKIDSKERCNHISNIELIINYDEYKNNYIRSPKVINKDNNCTNFEGTLKYKFKRFFLKWKKD